MVGNGTGEAITTGYSNVGVGDNAMPTVTTGYQNISIGRYAGYGATTGNTNTLVGYLCGYAGGASNQISTGSGNVLLGAYTNLSAGTDSSSIVVGNSITGRGSNTGMYGGYYHVYNQPNVSYWSVYSDQRLKKNITDSSVGLDAINAVRIRNYEYKTEDDLSEIEADGLCRNDIIEQTGTHVGVIAQELQAVMPDCVNANESTGVLTVNPENLQWALLKAVQELSAKNDALEARIATLEG